MGKIPEEPGGIVRHERRPIRRDRRAGVQHGGADLEQRVELVVNATTLDEQIMQLQTLLDCPMDNELLWLQGRLF